MRGAARGRTRVAALAAAAVSALALGACGDDETTTGEPDADAWAVSSEAACEGGIEEAIALPLPSSGRQIAADAQARGAILTTVRNEITALGEPEGVDPETLDAYVAELDADIDQLEAAAGGDRRAARLDESAGQVALELELDECAAFANAIARTP